ncbi:hypothetical protein V8E55_006854 [Tylopilus felleus]
MSHRRLPPLQPEQWLVQRLENIAQFDPRFEASWYGPYNALLSHYFPYQQQFLIKPQPKIRDAEEADVSFSSVQAEPSIELDESLDEDSFAAVDLSMNSMGFATFTGTGRIYIPDFIVAKATQFASHDRPLLIAEVKVDEPTDEFDWVTYQNQLDEYMDSLSNQMSSDTPLVGLLICGTKVKIFRLEGPGSSITMDRATHSINSKAVRELLQKISTDNWGY